MDGPIELTNIPYHHKETEVDNSTSGNWVPGPTFLILFSTSVLDNRDTIQSQGTVKNDMAYQIRLSPYISHFLRASVLTTGWLIAD